MELTLTTEKDDITTFELSIAMDWWVLFLSVMIATFPKWWDYLITLVK